MMVRRHDSSVEKESSLVNYLNLLAGVSMNTSRQFLSKYALIALLSLVSYQPKTKAVAVSATIAIAAVAYQAGCYIGKYMPCLNTFWDKKVKKEKKKSDLEKAIDKRQKETVVA